MSALFTCWGTRGSIPRSGAEFREFGGATSCYQITHAGRCVVLDAGTGIVGLGEDLLAQGVRQVDLMLTHFHLDHVMGLPFFAPLYSPDFSIRIWTSAVGMAMPGAEMLAMLLRPPFLPMGPDDIRAHLTFHSLSPDQTADLGDGIRIDTLPLMHPGGNAAVKLWLGGQSVVYSGDFEGGDGACDRAFGDFVAGVDLAVLDCTVSPQDVAQGRSYGHLDWRGAGRLGQKARRWIGTHHHHRATDTVLRQREAQIIAAYPNGGLARDGLRIMLE